MKTRLQMVEEDLIKIISSWDPSVVDGPTAAEKIKDEIKFSGLAPQTEQLYLMYVDKTLPRILDLARVRRLKLQHLA